MRTAETVLNIRRETALPFRVEITGERRDTETVMRRSEGGDWKSASKGNSLVAYPTASTVLRGGGCSDAASLPDPLVHPQKPTAL
jgi:hypothetical protein